MKKFFRLSILASASLLCVACSTIKLSKKDVHVDPLPMEVIGQHVSAKVHIRFAPKAFPKNLILKLTPVLRYQGGEVKGETMFYQGEEVLANNVVIPYESGENVTLNVSIPYLKSMKSGVLFLQAEVDKNGSIKKLDEIKLAEGVSATEDLAIVGNITAAAVPDGFQRIVNEKYDANIHFLIQQANVRSSELNKDEIEEWTYLVENAEKEDDLRVNVEVQAYASPDGKQDINEKLSANREKSTTSVLKREFNKRKIGGVEINTHYTAEDWDGFKELVAQSELKDKDLVLRVLEMYPDAESREREIRNISAVFSQLTDDILPKLRRSRLIANIQIIGRSDEQILSFLEKAPNVLSIEELLYAAKLKKDKDSRVRLYQLINRLHPRDYRAYNNIGVEMFNAGNYELAKFWFDKAGAIKDNKFTTMNQGLLLLRKGEVHNATPMIAGATDVAELGQALAYLYLKRGKYAEAQTLYGDYKSNNAAVAQLLNKDYRKALLTLDAIVSPNAMTYYIKAVVAARMQDKAMLMSALKQAFAMDKKLVNLAEEDLEFAKYSNTEEFSQMLISALKK